MVIYNDNSIVNKRCGNRTRVNLPTLTLYLYGRIWRLRGSRGAWTPGEIEFTLTWSRFMAAAVGQFLVIQLHTN
jgi:hypothetical protein